MSVPEPTLDLPFDPSGDQRSYALKIADGSCAASEWLETDDLGGFASGTVGLIRTRRYHALLLSAVRPPSERLVLVNGIEAWLQHGDRRLALTTQCYEGALCDPDGAGRVQGFSPAPWPTWRFNCEALGELLFEVAVIRASGDTVLRWRAAEPKRCDGWRLHVRPLLSVRAFHALHHENPAFDFTPDGDGSRVSWKPYPDRPAISALSNGAYRHAPDWFRRFWYAAEAERGLDASEDLASPGVFEFRLGAEPAILIFRAGDSRQVAVEPYAGAALATEHRRRAEFTSPITRAADQYLVERGRGHTLIAGYPWFGDWGRDTFIAMRGLLIATGRLRFAYATLTAWAQTVSQGMLPNRFPDNDGPPEYNSVDASLWYVIAYHDYAAAARPDAAARAPIEKAIEAIIDGYRAGTRFGIREDIDGLLAAGETGVQLTWMDAKIGDEVVTPRIGKPVEIQALWYNALRIAGSFAPRFAPLADRVQAAFRARFLSSDTRGTDAVLADVVDCDHVPGRVDGAIRPNQVFAVGGLPFAVIDGDAAHRVIEQVERTLLTPMGLRTLAPDHPAYVGRYGGSPLNRDRAYHQGTVWPWLLGAFVDGWLRVHGNKAATRARAREQFLAPLQTHLSHAGLGHVSEIADGNWPHTPRGAPFQAWSLGELLRIEQWLAEVDSADHAARGATSDV
ncbi:amylo-alpha-1,6-glucosidase [Chitinasiproducens palmae]|uniref:Glycogen debranching enzyme, putative n=1 Tax=Chitinasiproducens palmae TaxID=1770053 RepID=A0A1H2PT11_9BURK|nr:amylo-alpha-1,6-glucosidase [Chitinasiproducens palmae]SDV49761.1 glycogen debranching enzyme, putative [Chitinasiproducens palmae]